MPLWIILALAVVGIGLPARAESPAGAISDGAGLFNAETTARAEKEIADIRRTYHRDLVVETVKSVPDADLKRVRGMNRREAAAYFAGWATERAQMAKVDGIYMLVCQEPKRYVQVSVFPEGSETVLTATERDRTEQLFLNTWGRSGPNNALLAALERIKEALKGRFPPEGAQADSSAFSWWTFGYILLAFLALWLVLGLIRARLATPPADGIQGVSQGRVTVMSGLLGGMFGSVAGHWIYDTLFHHHHDERREAAPPPERPDRPAVGEAREGTP
jgi:hypothetical protein